MHNLMPKITDQAELSLSMKNGVERVSGAYEKLVGQLSELDSS